jgi:anti-sigma factor RsiW
MLSMFESALLERHLRGCASCRAFAVSADAQAALLRGAPLERLERPVELPAPVRRIGRGAVGTLAATLTAAAAAVAVVFSSGGPANGPTLSAARGAPVMISYPARPSISSSNKIEVPRLRLQPASIADGPVHGLFNDPV